MKTFVKHVTISKDTQSVEVECFECQEANPAYPIDDENNLEWTYCQTIEDEDYIVVEFLAYCEGESL